MVTSRYGLLDYLYHGIFQNHILLNLGAVVDAADSSFDSIIKANIYLADIQDFAEVNEFFISFFPGLKPVRILEPW